MKYWLTLIFILLLAGSPLAEIPPFPSGDAWDNLLTQCEMGPRNPGSDGHETCRRWLVKQLKSWGYQVEQHWFIMDDPYSEGDLELVNIRAWRPDWKGAFTTLGAHWDTRPRADKDPDRSRREEPIIGASDGASGVAILLSLAKLCAKTPPPRPVEFLFFDGEDYGLAGRHQDYLLGSRRFVRDHPGYRPDLLILLDLVGGKTLQLPMERYSLTRAGDRLHILYDLAEELDLPAFQKRPGRFVYDDHVMFLDVGIPAVDLVDLDFPEWHTVRDIPEVCSEASLDQVGTLMVHYLYK